MTARHYDVVVLGRSIGALLTAALLCRRELRVLVLGQGVGAPLYKVEGHTLARRAFSMLAATSPVFRRILQELAQTQRFRQLTQPLDPMFSLLSTTTRFEVAPDIELFSREIEREYPEISQPIAEFYTQISLENAQVDAAFERDVLWPPGTTWEKLETGRIASALPARDQGDGHAPLLARMPRDHGFRKVVELPALFASHTGLSAEDLNRLSLSRLHGAWTRGVHSLPRGEQDLEDFLVERITANGGSCRLEGRATQLITRRGRVVGIIEDGEEHTTGAEAVVFSGTGEQLAELSGGEGVSKKARENWPRVSQVGGRFVVSLLVDDHGLPAPLAHDSFLVRATDSLPDLHLQRMSAEPRQSPSEERDGPAPPSRSLLVAEMLLPQDGGVHLLGARQAVLTALESCLPFLSEHLIVVDSPHDGLPAWLYEKNESGKNVRKEVERIHIKGVSPGPEAMEGRLQISPPGYLGVGGEPLRGPITGTYLVGASVLPGLGQEGEVLAAWGVARILTKKDSARQKLRRQMWTKIETS